MSTTNDPKDPRLTHGVDSDPVPQAEAYLVLSDEERAKGFVRPVRQTYLHVGCPSSASIPVTTMGLALAETYARDPEFYGATYCACCNRHRPVGAAGEFVWFEDGRITDVKVGT